MCGRCRRAASIRARTPGRRRCASCTKRPISARSKSSLEIAEWLPYDLPPDVAQAWKGRYRGQTQKWYALRFTGDESEIDIAHPAGGHEPEFVEWRWEPMRNLPDLVIPFKRPVYERVAKEFAESRAINLGSRRAGLRLAQDNMRACRARVNARIPWGCQRISLQVARR